MATKHPLKKVKAAKAAEVCEHFELREESRPLLGESTPPREFLEALLAAGQHQSAIAFLAHALPHREAIWWGCLCLKHVAGAGLPESQTAAFKVAAEWVLEPTEERRSAAKRPAEAAGTGNPAGLLATAVTWTGGSLSPPFPKVAPVPPGPYMPAKGVSGAVQLASVKVEPIRIAETQRLFVELGIGVAEGRSVWPEVKPQPHRRTWGI